ncbi:hypothetical protein KR009_007308 [Drosophila setifemur]|nr:hypothetical protein KR009_007308 [Drosophila setifemur]
MGLKRLMAAMVRTSPIRASKPGTLAKCPPVFSEDGMWNTVVRQQVTNGLQRILPKKDTPKGTPSSCRLTRKRSWLLARNLKGPKSPRD